MTTFNDKTVAVVEFGKDVSASWYSDGEFGGEITSPITITENIHFWKNRYGNRVWNRNNETNDYKIVFSLNRPSLIEILAE